MGTKTISKESHFDRSNYHSLRTSTTSTTCNPTSNPTSDKFHNELLLQPRKPEKQSLCLYWCQDVHSPTHSTEERSNYRGVMTTNSA